MLILNNLRQAKHTLSIALAEVENFTENTEFYIKAILKTKRKDIAKEFSSQLHKRLQILNGNLDRKNIELVSINRASLLIDHHADYYTFHVGLNRELRRKGTFAFSVGDVTKKIYLSTDKLYFIEPEHPDTSMHEPPAVNIVDTLIHEASHIDRLTSDLFYFRRTGQGKMLPILDEVDRFLENIKKTPDGALQKIIKINQNYLNEMHIYHDWKDKILSNDVTFQYFSSCETGILANYYLHNADFITKIAQDLFQNAFVDRPQLSFLERMGQQLNVG